MGHFKGGERIGGDTEGHPGGTAPLMTGAGLGREAALEVSRGRCGGSFRG